MRKLKLELEPVPASSWGISLANKLPKKEWDRLRREAYQAANYQCMICGALGSRLNAHERWVFNDKKRVQQLKELVCCCDLCHDVCHFGRSLQVYSKQYVAKLVRHWCTVNGRSVKDFKVHELETRELNRKRADKFYTVKVGRKVLI